MDKINNKKKQKNNDNNNYYYYTHLMASFPGQPGQASTRKVKSLDLNEARDYGVFVCSGTSWTICKQSAPRSRQITTLNIFRPDALSDAQPTVAKHWRQQRQQHMHRYKTQPLGLLMYFRTTSKGENSELKKSTKMNHITVSTIAIATKRRWCEALGLQRRSNGVIYMV